MNCNKRSNAMKTLLMVGTIGTLVGCVDAGPQAPAATQSAVTSDGLAMVSGDFDGDGSLDAAVAAIDSDTGAGALSILAGAGNGYRQPRALTVPEAALACDQLALIITNGNTARANLNLVSPCTGEHWLYRGSADGLMTDPQAGTEGPALLAELAAPEGVATLEQSVRQPPAIDWDDMTALQRHVAFFDYDGDGYVTLGEDYRGLRALGLDPVSSAAFATIINGALGTSTIGYPSLTISIYGIAGAVHGSDTGIYDSQGRFNEEQFDRLFADWDKNGDGGLNALELARRTVVEADLWDVFGVVASTGEFGLLFAVAAEDGKLSRDRMRAFYDGTLFYTLAEEREGQPWWGWWW